MKTYIYSILLIVAVLGTSCDNFLDTKSRSSFTEETTFSNLDFATKAVLGIYSTLTSTYLYEAPVNLYYSCDNDIEHTTGVDDAAQRALCRYKANDGNTYIYNPWRMLYQTIERSNLCIDNIPKSSIWTGEFSKEAHRLYGEAVTLRAQCYFELIKNWGDVPFSVKSVEDGDNFQLPKTNRDSIYEYLINELGEVAEYVPWQKETGTAERVNKAFVKGLRARMALSYAGYSLRNGTLKTERGRYWEDYYKIARQECLEVMQSGQHQMNPDFKGIFKLMCEYKQDVVYGESLFEIGFGRLQSGRIGNVIGMRFRTGSPVDPKYGRANGDFLTNPYYFYSFDTLDVRRNVTCELYNYNLSTASGLQSMIDIDSWSICKWRKSWIVPSMGGEYKEAQYTGVNWPLMRYTDIVLMFAEAENELNGPTEDAKNALKSVRKRAFSTNAWTEKVDTYVENAASDKETFFNAIVNERAWEFGGEMIRKQDLVRWNLLGNKINKMKDECTKILNNDVAWQNIPNYIFWKRSADGESIDILNVNHRETATAVTGYTRTSWLSGASQSTKDRLTLFLSRIASGYDATKNNHLYPISASVITESNGVLNNDQMHQ